MKSRLFLGMCLIWFMFITACVPWGKERYFLFSFVQLDDPDFEVELSIMTEYAGDKPPSQPTDTLFIDIAEDSSLKEVVETATFEFEDMSIKGSITIGETIEIDRTPLSNNELYKIVEEAKPLNLKIEYVDRQNKVNSRTITLKYNGAPIKYYKK